MTPEEEYQAAKRMARALLEMVGELHRRGYERLRATPAMSPSGMYWRLVVTAAGQPSAGDEEGAAARYTTGVLARPYGWEDAADDPPGVLAIKFASRFPRLADAGRGADPAYAAWYREVLAATAPDGLLIAYDAESEPGDPWRGWTEARGAFELPSPPEGEPLPRRAG